MNSRYPRITVLCGLAAGLILAGLGEEAWAQANRGRQNARNYPPRFSDAEARVYKTVGDVKLQLYIFYPEGHQPTDRRAAAVFFFGGGWRSGNPQQFAEHCRLLAKHGMVAITADYRVSSRHETQARHCVADGKSAIVWMRRNAAELGIDPQRIAAGGGSAGGHVAACTGVIDGFEDESDADKFSSRPNALLLFNPALALASVEGRPPFDAERLKSLEQRMGVEPEKLSPVHHVGKDEPPTIVFHGRADTTVPFWTAEAFAEAMEKAGNRVELKGYDDAAHGFFNYGRGNNQAFQQTTDEMVAFLRSLKFIEP